MFYLLSQTVRPHCLFLEGLCAAAKESGVSVSQGGFLPSPVPYYITAHVGQFTCTNCFYHSAGNLNM